MKRYPIYRVMWQDSAAWLGWKPDEGDPVPAECESAGFLVRRNRQHIVLALSIDNHGRLGDCIAIPRSVVRSMERWK